MAPRVWLDARRSGFGAQLVNEVLANGDCCIATARKPETLHFDAGTSDNLLIAALDVTNVESIRAAFKAGMDKWKRIDVVVNNAGYGLQSAFEELSPEQIKQQFETNVYGLMEVTRTALEIMREHGGGLIQQISSFAGFVGIPTLSIYCASKFAIEGFTESLAKELKPEWNIKLQIIQPGGFRTDWFGTRMQFAEKRHPAYDHQDARGRQAQHNGKQPGDPKKAAKAMFKLATMDNPPFRAVIGSDAQKATDSKLKALSDQYNSEEWRAFAASTDIGE